MNNSNDKIYNLTLALAGIFQAACVVRDLAKSGTTDEKAFETTIHSIYQIEAPDVPSVYGDIKNLKIGFVELIKLFNNDKSNIDPYVTRYAINVIHLERRLSRKLEVQKILTRRIKHAVSQANYFSPTHPTVIGSLADIYLNTLGTLPFRIHVLGQAKYLHQPEIVAKVRASLLAGVRSAVLWRQLGGKRWQLFLWRKKLTQMAKQLLAEC